MSIGLAVLVAAGTAGCTDAQTAVSPSSSTTTAVNVFEEQRAAGVQSTLDDLSAAILAGDGARLAPLIDPAASPAFRARLQVAAADFSGRVVHAETAASRSAAPTAESSASRSAASRSAASRSAASRPPASPSSPAPVPPRGTALRLKEFRYEIAPTNEAEVLVPPALQGRLDAQGSSDSWVAPVELHYALGGATTPGVDEPDIMVDLQLVMARYGDDWKVVGDSTAIGGTAPPTQMWDLPGLAASDVHTGGGTSVITSYAGTDSEVAKVRRLLPGAVASVTDFWGDDWPQRAVVVATQTPEQFRLLSGSAGTDVTGAAAATVFTRVDTDAREAVGQRVILTPSSADLPEPALGVVLRHELTHVAARVSTSPGAPLWITEGVPEYVGRKGTYVRFDDAAPNLATRIRAGEVPADLPEDRDFAVDSDEALVAYQSAWSIARYVAGRFGDDKLKALYLGVAGTDDRRRQDQAVSDALGVSRVQLVSSWRRWLTAQER